MYILNPTQVGHKTAMCNSPEGRSLRPGLCGARAGSASPGLGPATASHEAPAASSAGAARGGPAPPRGRRAATGGLDHGLPGKDDDKSQAPEAGRAGAGGAPAPRTTAHGEGAADAGGTRAGPRS